jgi:hypothetical protein
MCQQQAARAAQLHQRKNTCKETHQVMRYVTKLIEAKYKIKKTVRINPGNYLSIFQGLFKEIEDDDMSDDNNHTQIKLVDKHKASRQQSQQNKEDIKKACILQLINNSRNGQKSICG